MSKLTIKDALELAKDAKAFQFAEYVLGLQAERDALKNKLLAITKQKNQLEIECDLPLLALQHYDPDDSMYAELCKLANVVWDQTRDIETRETKPEEGEQA